MKASKILVFS